MKLAFLLELVPKDTWGYDFMGVLSEHEILDLELNLDFKFPVDFRNYLMHYNGLLFPFDYIFCLKKYDTPYLFDLLSEKQSLVKDGIIPDNFIPFNYDEWSWLYWFLKTKAGVFHLYGENLMQTHSSFTKWVEEKFKTIAELEKFTLPDRFSVEFDWWDHLIPRLPLPLLSQNLPTLNLPLRIILDFHPL